MRVEFLGGVRTVTGSATLLERGSLKWLVDCGMFQGGKELEERNWHLQPYQAKNLSFILFILLILYYITYNDNFFIWLIYLMI
jgi:metallo-beta-lactamase family protein